MSQIENHLGCFSENPTRFHKEFLCITQVYHVTWADPYYILTATLSPDKRNHIWQSAREHADQLHGQNPGLHPVAHNAIPSAEPDWAYQFGDAGTICVNHMIFCLLEGMKNNAHTQVNYDKIREVTQRPEENPALFLACLMDAITKYTNLDLNCLAGILFIHVQFIDQSAPRYSKKLRQLEW
jgi:hypothetical protein